MLNIHRVLCLFLAFLLTVQPAWGWSEGGHHLIAVLAYDLMPPAQQKTVIELLKQHPRYSEDFKVPDSAQSADQLGHWMNGSFSRNPKAFRKLRECSGWSDPLSPL